MPQVLAALLTIGLVFGVALILLNRRLDAEAKAKQEAEDAESRREIEATCKAIDDFFASNPRYEETLLRMRSRLVYVDEFGDERRERWENAVENFVREKMKDVDGVQGWIDNGLMFAVKGRVASHIGRLQSFASKTVAVDECNDPVEFEEACRRLFEAHGFDASRVGGVNDQGADVIASLRGLRVAVQCKFYSSPVGNQAVQQAEAARQFYDCSIAAVVGTSGFTPSARMLAGKLGVTLADATELPDVIRQLAATA
jgi:restriction system protein